MAVINKGNGTEKGGGTQTALPPPPVMKEKPKEVQVPQLLGPNQVELEITYNRDGKRVMENELVPRSLISALTDPGETGMGPVDAMRDIREFYTEKTAAGFEELTIRGADAPNVLGGKEGMVTLGKGVVSSLVQSSYREHSVVAADTRTVQENLCLEDPEVQRNMRLTAALAQGKEAEKITDVLQKTTFFSTRTIVEVTQKPTVNLVTKRLLCETGSHRVERDVPIPDRTTVEHVRETSQQRLARRPQVKQTFDDTVGAIEKRTGRTLGPDERNVVASYINTHFIEKAEDRLPIIVPR